MNTSIWIAVAAPEGVAPAVENVVALARSVPGRVNAVVAGSRPAAEQVAACGLDRVLWLGEPGDHPVEAYAAPLASTVAKAVAEEGGSALVLVADRPADRALAGALAAALEATVLAGVTAIEARADDLVVTRNALGGISIERLAVGGPLVAVTYAGAPVTPEPGPGVEIETVPAEPAAVRIVATEAAPTSGQDLLGADRVVSVGRGLREPADLAVVEELAAALGAALACSRPLAEGTHVLPKDRYVGVSGQTVTPKLYLALGISGQMQHMVGVRGAGTIVAVNTDPNAPIFAEADYGVVGDLYAVVPALTRALSR